MPELKSSVTRHKQLKHNNTRWTSVSKWLSASFLKCTAKPPLTRSHTRGRYFEIFRPISLFSFCNVLGIFFTVSAKTTVASVDLDLLTFKPAGANLSVFTYLLLETFQWKFLAVLLQTLPENVSRFCKKANECRAEAALTWWRN